MRYWGMSNRAAPALVLRPGDREELRRWQRCSSIRAGLVQRSKIVLLAAEGMANQRIAEELAVSRPTINKWRARYAAEGIEGLADADRPGRPATVDQTRIIAATLRQPPKK